MFRELDYSLSIFLNQAMMAPYISTNIFDKT